MTPGRIRTPGPAEVWVPPRSAPARPDLLRWLYVGRLLLGLGVLVGAAWIWNLPQPEGAIYAAALLGAALAVTGGSFWHTHLRGGEPGRSFLYGQVVFDVLLVTGIVHLTGGGSSDFAWLYILVISEGALLLPLPGGVLIGGLASVLYFADIVWGHEETLTGSVALQIGLFALVALATGVIGDRLRRAGLALGAVQSELRRLRMDTGEILATISTGVLTLDKEERLVYMNPAARNLLGLERPIPREGPVLEAVEPVAPGLVALLRRSLEGEMTLSRRKAIVHRGGERVTLGVSTTLREEGGQVVAVTAIFQDITKLEAMEALNRRNERLEAVAELSAAMAHEIRNPLSSIRSAVEQFARAGLEEEDRTKLTGMVVRESERLSRLLGDFIDFARVRVDRLEPVEAEGILKACVAVVEEHPQTQARGVRIELEPGCSGVRVPADGDLLHRALFNLLLNAVQFSPEGGVVTVGVEDLRDRPVGRGVQVPSPLRIRIRDRGPGIPPDRMERIFDPFYTTREGGTGLGLAVVHRAVEAHRGTVLAENREGGGMEFSLYLTTAAVEAGAPERTGAEATVP